jgi:2-amino-4-hydroxy-6-hydroxymethyldihydropteridine diphosphokinase
MNNIAYISLGTNMGEREGNLSRALKLLKHDNKIDLMNISSIYETDPVGYIDQPAFLNLVAKIHTTYSPLELLTKLQQIEAELGRIRDVRWGPRTIDLDILLYNQENIQVESLIVPHPRMLERGFVLIPLYELNPHIKIPGNMQSLEQNISQLLDKEGVRLWKRISGVEELELFVN